MASSAILFAVFFLSLSLHVFAGNPDDICPATSCQPGGTEIRFPFHLRDVQPEQCGYPGFDLSCNNQSQVILQFPSLPDPQDFAVDHINYEEQYVVLKDLSDCLVKRLLHLQLSSSFFQAQEYESFMFMYCPVNVSVFGIRQLDCLSRGHQKVLLTDVYDPRLQNLSKFGCLPWRATLPVSWDHESVSLNWRQPDCRSCEVRGERCGLTGSTGYQVGCFGKQGLSKSSHKFVILPAVMVPSLLCISGVACYLSSRARFSRHRHRHGQPPNYNNGETNVEDISSPSSPPRETQLTCNDTVGLDLLTIESYPKIQVSDDGGVPRPDDNICSICLAEYHPKDTLRTIPNCGHYFHVQCIDQWLGRKASCPMCRYQKGSSCSTALSN